MVNRSKKNKDVSFFKGALSGIILFIVMYILFALNSNLELLRITRSCELYGSYYKNKVRYVCIFDKDYEPKFVKNIIRKY